MLKFFLCLSILTTGVLVGTVLRLRTLWETEQARALSWHVRYENEIQGHSNVDELRRAGCTTLMNWKRGYEGGWRQ